MMSRLAVLLLVAGWSSAPDPVYATIASATHLKIDFTDSHDAHAKATWSNTNRLNVTTNGLGWDGEAAGIQDGWIHTQPVGVGLAWRPTTAVNLRVRMEPQSASITLNSGQKYTPYAGRAFARYSPDCKHWSSWHELRRNSTNEPGVRQGSMGIPLREQERFRSFRDQYAKLDVPWTDNTEAFVEWLLQREPEFFATSLPFIGYVEFLVERAFHGSQRIKSFEAEIFWNVSGLHQPPKDETLWKEMRTPWRLKAR